MELNLLNVMKAPTLTHKEIALNSRPRKKINPTHWLFNKSLDNKIGGANRHREGRG